jgi:hypothetical protein
MDHEILVLFGKHLEQRILRLGSLVDAQGVLVGVEKLVGGMKRVLEGVTDVDA